MNFKKEYFNQKIKWRSIIYLHLFICIIATIIGFFCLDIISRENFLLVLSISFFTIIPIAVVLGGPLILIALPIYLFYVIKMLRSRKIKNFVIFEIIHIMAISFSILFLTSIPA